MLKVGERVEFNGKPVTVVALRDGQAAIPWTVKCNVTGCRRVKRGYLTESYGNGAFYDKRGALLADLREKVFVCGEHGVKDHKFLIEDKEVVAHKRKTDRAAASLRKAAAAFAVALKSPVTDVKDRAFAALNRRLLTAAVRYAESRAS